MDEMKGAKVKPSGRLTMISSSLDSVVERYEDLRHEIASITESLDGSPWNPSKKESPTKSTPGHDPGVLGNISEKIDRLMDIGDEIGGFMSYLKEEII